MKRSGSGSRPAAIVLGGDIGGWGTIQELARAGVPVVCVSWDAHDVAHRSRHLCDRVVARGAFDGEALARTLERLAERYPGAAVVPTNDWSLLAVARARERLSAAGLRPACPPLEAVLQVVDKGRTHAIAERAGVPVPATYAPAQLSAARELAGPIAYPCLVKPTHSHLFFARFRRKAFVARSRSELIALLRRAREGGCEVRVQELVPGGAGALLGYLVHLDAQGRPAAEAFVRKIRQNPPLLGMGAAGATVEADPAVRRAARSLLDAIGWRGFAFVEFKRRARTGEPVLIEVNGRLNRSRKCDRRLGVSFPLLAYLDALGRLDGARPAAVPRAGVSYIDVMADLHRLLLPGSRPRILRELVRPYAQPNRVLIDLALDDPVPTALRIARGLAQCGRTLARRALGGTDSLPS